MSFELRDIRQPGLDQPHVELGEHRFLEFVVRLVWSRRDRRRGSNSATGTGQPVTDTSREIITLARALLRRRFNGVCSNRCGLVRANVTLRRLDAPSDIRQYSSHSR